MEQKYMDNFPYIRRFPEVLLTELSEIKGIIS